jgi:hypothetical protein
MFDVFRAVLPDGGQHKGTSNCRYPECPKSTREGKPFCSKHIENAPYIQVILGKLADRKEEELLLDEPDEENPLDLDKSFFVRETLLLLRTKDFTSKGLARRLDITHNAAKLLISLMHNNRLARMRKTSRGDLTISGLGPRDLRDVDEDKK